MAKQKKGKCISSLDKTLGRIMSFETQNPVEFRKIMERFKSQYKEYSEELGLTGNPSEAPNVPRESLQFYHDICQEDRMQDYICLVRTLLAGYWNTHRIVYSFTRETIDFLEKELRVQDFCISVCALQESAANEPILIELPAGYPIQKAFFGRVSFFNEATTKSFARGTVDFCLFSCLIKKNDAAVLISAADDMPVWKTMQKDLDGLDGCDEEVQLLAKLVAYIGYMKGMKDTKDSVFEEEPIKNGIRYKVLPAHAEGPTADETTMNGWIRAGLARVMGYYDRSNMIRDFYRDVSQVEQPFVNDTLDSATNFIERMVLSWETSRNLYGFKNEFVLSLPIPWLEDTLFTGISSDLLDYMPYNVMAIYPTESTSFLVSLVSRCTLEDGAPGIFVAVFGQSEESHTISCFYEGESLVDGTLKEALKKIDTDTAIVLCIFKHILTILQRKALRRMNSSRQPALPGPRLHGKELSIPAVPIIRQGGDVSDIVPIAMYDLTRRAVKRVARKEEARRSGWKMTPHTRRRHPHRYWVGRGENRHQEIRWLENIHVNKQNKDALPAVTVHEVK